MRTHEEMTAIFEKAKANGQEVTFSKEPYCPPGGLLGNRYTLEWNGHKEVAYDTQQAVNEACDRICDLIEGAA